MKISELDCLLLRHHSIIFKPAEQDDGFKKVGRIESIDPVRIKRYTVISDGMRYQIPATAVVEIASIGDFFKQEFAVMDPLSLHYSVDSGGSSDQAYRDLLVYHGNFEEYLKAIGELLEDENLRKIKELYAETVCNVLGNVQIDFNGFYVNDKSRPAKSEGLSTASVIESMSTNSRIAELGDDAISTDLITGIDELKLKPGAKVLAWFDGEYREGTFTEYQHLSDPKNPLTYLVEARKGLTYNLAGSKNLDSKWHIKAYLKRDVA